VVHYVNVASTHAAEVYLEAEQLLQAEGERVRRDLLDELLVGRLPAPGPQLDAAKEAGLGPESSCLVIAASARSAADAAAATLLRSRRRCALRFVRLWSCAATKS
jgi:hypothetical protein